jgi:ribosomal-protein-alanine N-acetyltransferase
MLIRPLDAQAAPAMAALHAASFPRGWSAEEIAEMLAVPHTLALGIWQAETLIAMLMLRSAGEDVDILTLAVAHTHRRQGLAEKLMQAAMEQLHMQGATRLLLEVALVNQGAIALYGKLGFSEIGRRAQYYRQADGTRADAVVMEKRLGG